MDRDIFYDSKQKLFYYRSINKNYISRETILKSFLGDNLISNYPYTFDSSIGHLIDLNENLKIDYIIFKNLKLVTSLKFSKDFSRVFQSFDFPDLLNYSVNTIFPENIYGIILIENQYNQNRTSKNNSYFYWVDKISKKVYKPSYNNIYENGNLCLGDNLNIEKPFFNLAEKAKILFEENPTNGDLNDYESSNFISFDIRENHLNHNPLYIKLKPIGIDSTKQNYLNLIMGDFLK